MPACVLIVNIIEYLAHFDLHAEGFIKTEHKNLLSSAHFRLERKKDFSDAWMKKKVCPCAIYKSFKNSHKRKSYIYIYIYTHTSFEPGRLSSPPKLLPMDDAAMCAATEFHRSCVFYR